MPIVTKVVDPDQNNTYQLTTTPLDFGAYTIINAGGNNAVFGAAGTSWSVTNDGALTTTGGNSAVDFQGGGSFTNNADGTVNGGVFLMGGAGTVANAGTLNGNVELQTSGSVTNNAGGVVSTGANYNGSAVQLDAGGSVVNAGSLSGSSLGVQLVDGGTLTNLGGGSIAGSDAGVVGGIQYPGSPTGFASQFNNRSGASITGEAGIYGAGPGDSVVNAGSITGTKAIVLTIPTGNNGTASVTLGDGVSLTGAGDTVTNYYDGVITGARYGVQLAGASGTVVNAGTISGVDGSVVFDGTGTNTLTLETGSTLVGAALGSAAAGATNDLDLVGVGTASNNFDNFNALTLAAGADWTLGGTSTIATTSVEGAMLDVTGTLTSAFKLGGGGTLELAKATDDSITFDGPGTLLVDKTYGGTISGFGFGDGVDFQNLSYNSDDTLSYASNGAGGGTVTISDKSSQPIATFNVTGSFASDDFVLTAVPGTGDLGVSLAASRYTTTGARQDAAYIFYPAPNSQTARGYGATHFYLVGSEVVNTGSIGDIWLWGAGDVVNEASGTIKGGIANDGYGVGLHNGGSFTNLGTSVGVQLDHGGTVNNLAGGAISGGYFGVSMALGLLLNGTSYGGGTLLNSAGATVSGYSGVYAGGKAATVTNSGAITGTVATTLNVTKNGHSATFIVGDGVMLGDGGSVSNLTGGTITGARYGVFVQTATGTVSNAGSISGAHSGVVLGAGGAVYNLAGGSISSSGTYTAAVSLLGGGAVVNDGTLTNTGANTAGVYLKAGGTVENNAQITVTGVNAAGQGASGIYEGGAVAAYVTNTGTIQTTWGADIYLAGGGIVDNQTGANLIASGTHDSSIFLGASGQVTNAGTITGTGSYFTGVYLKNGGFADNSGTISIDVSAATKGHAAGIQLGNGGSVTNSGYVKSFGTHVGAVYSKSGGLLVNSGTLFGEADTAGYASGVDFHSGGHIDNLKGGVIEATGAHIAAVEFDAGGSVYNAGSIYANGGSSGPVDGVYGKTGARAIVTNDGSIVAKGGSNVVGVLLAGGGQVSNQNGTIRGGSGVVAKNALATVYNFASISGSGKYGVYLQAGGSVTDFGSISGPTASVKFGGSGVNTLTLGTGATLTGNAVGSAASTSNALILEGTGTAANKFQNFNTLEVQSGAVWTLTGTSTIGQTTVDGSLTAGAGVATAFTLDTGSTLALTAPNTDSVNFMGAATLEVTLNTIGNNFTGTISGENSGDTIDLVNLSNAHIVSQNASGGQTLLDLSGTVGGQTVSEQFAFNNATLAGDFTLISDGHGGTRVGETTTFVNPVQSNTYNLNPARNPIYFQAGTNINVSGATGVYGASGTNWTVTNAGAITGSGAASDGLLLKGSGSLTNKASGVIGASGGSGAGVYFNSGTLANFGKVTTDGANASAVMFENAGTVVNSGQISATYVNANPAGVQRANAIYLVSGGTVDNDLGATISSSAGPGIRAGVNGTSAVYLVVDNSGTISGAGLNHNGVWSWGGANITNEATGVITVNGSGNAGAVGAYRYAKVVNDGAIKAYGSGAYGVALNDGGTVTNSGTIAAYGANGGDAWAGVVLGQGGATLDNLASGKISGQVGVYDWSGGTAATVDNAGTITGASYGVELQSGGSVTDFGAISGNNASVEFGGSGANTLTLGTGASLSGAVIGSSANGATNTLFLQGTGTATNNFDYFTSLQVQTGAAWTLDGSASFHSITAWTGGSVTLDGFESGPSLAIDNFGGAIVLGATGTLENVTISDPASGLTFEGGTLSDVTYEGALNLAPAGSSVFISGPFADTGAGGTGFGVVNVGANSLIGFDGSESIDNLTINLQGANAQIEQVGTAQIVLGAQAGIGDGLVGGGIVGNTNSLVFGANARIDDTSTGAVSLGGAETASITNNGWIEVEGQAGQFDVGSVASFVNNGTIDESPGTDVSFVSQATSFVNMGDIYVNNFDNISIANTFTNDGTVDFGGSTAQFYNAIGTGTFELLGGATVKFTQSAANTLTFEFNGVNNILEIGSNATLSREGPFGFNTFNEIYLGGETVTRTAYTSTGPSTAVLALFDGNLQVGTLQLEGVSADDLITLNAQGGDTAIDISGNSTFAATAAYVSANIDALEVDAAVTSIVLRDNVPTLALTAAQAANDTRVLGEIAGAFTVAVSDTVSNVELNLDGLQADTHLASISLQGGGGQWVIVSTSQAIDDAGALAKMNAAAGLTINIKGAASDVAALTPADIAALEVGGATIVVTGANSDGSVDDVTYQAGATWFGVSYAQADAKYSASNVLLSVTYENSSGDALAVQTYDGAGGYTITIGGSPYETYAVNSQNGDVDITTYQSGTSWFGASYTSEDTEYSSSGAVLSNTYYQGAAVSGKQTWDGSGGYTVTVNGSPYETYAVNSQNGDVDYTTYQIGASWFGASYTSEDSEYSSSGALLSNTYYEGAAVSGKQTWDGSGGYTVSVNNSPVETYKVNSQNGSVVSVDYVTYQGGTSWFGASYTSLDSEYSSSGALLSNTYYEGAAESGEQTYLSSGAYETGLFGLTGGADSSVIDMYNATHWSVAEAQTLIGGGGNVLLYQSGLTVDDTQPALTISDGTNAFGGSELANSNVSLTATGLTSETFEFASGFGAASILGFDATTDHLDLSLSAFGFGSGLTQAEDVSALLSGATGTTDTVLKDLAGDTLTLKGVASATLAANPSAFVFS